MENSCGGGCHVSLDEGAKQSINLANLHEV